MGHVGREQLYEAYKAAAALAVLSLWPEPFGKVGIEAMSVGRPVVASDVGGMSEWLKECKKCPHECGHRWWGVSLTSYS